MAKKMNPKSIANLVPMTEEIREKGRAVHKQKLKARKEAKYLLVDNYEAVAEVLALPPDKALQRMQNPKNQMEAILFERLLNINTAYGAVLDLSDRVLGKPKIAVDLEADINEDAGLLIKFENAPGAEI